jgi:hypothetical protein
VSSPSLAILSIRFSIFQASQGHPAAPARRYRVGMKPRTDHIIVEIEDTPENDIRIATIANLFNVSPSKVE